MVLAASRPNVRVPYGSFSWPVALWRSSSWFGHVGLDSITTALTRIAWWQFGLVCLLAGASMVLDTLRLAKHARG